MKVISNINISGSPTRGELYFDAVTSQTMVWDGYGWAELAFFSSSDIKLEPTHDELEKYPALRQAWDEYLMVRKLLRL